MGLTRNFFVYVIDLLSHGKLKAYDLDWSIRALEFFYVLLRPGNGCFHIIMSRTILNTRFKHHQVSYYLSTKRRNSIFYFCVQCEFYKRRTFFFSNVTFSFFPMIRYLIDILGHCFFNYCHAMCVYNLLRFAACMCI